MESVGQFEKLNFKTRNPTRNEFCPVGSQVIVTSLKTKKGKKYHKRGFSRQYYTDYTSSKSNTSHARPNKNKIPTKEQLKKTIMGMNTDFDTESDVFHDTPGFLESFVGTPVERVGDSTESNHDSCDSDITRTTTSDFSVQVSLSSDSDNNDHTPSSALTNVVVAHDCETHTGDSNVTIKNVSPGRRITRSQRRKDDFEKNCVRLSNDDIRKQGLLGYNFRTIKKKL